MNSLAIEIGAAAFGLLGTTLLAFNGRRAGWGFIALLASNAGWLAFSYAGGHWFLFVQQIGFTITSLIGVWRWLLRGRFYWGEWGGDHDGKVTMWIMNLLTWRGRKVDLHRMIDVEALGCFHTHPARAIRFVLWGGYTEELEDCTTRRWKPGKAGLVRPDLCHRISAVYNGRSSYSLWIRGAKTHKIELQGDGWPAGSEAA